MFRACLATFAFAGTLAVLPPAPAHAYEFWIRSRTFGQAYQLRDYKLIGPDLFVGRRRYTNTIALRIWDVGDLSAARRRARLPDRGLRISWQSYLRVDHDFGSYASGRIKLSEPTRRDAIDVVPELSESIAGLDLLYGYLELDGIAGDRVQLRLGRVLADDGWGTAGIDGGSARVELPARVAITAAAGLRVRASSVMGLSAYELDGTAGAGCREYVEGPTPGTGAWKLIDRARAIKNTRLESDYEYCPQREVRQPTIGVTVATSRVKRFGAEVGYRRTWSSTVGRIGEVDRLMYPDVGLYPNEVPGQATASGVNEERIHARVHGQLRAGGFGLQPFANARYSLLHATLDRADTGVSVTRGRHAVEPAVEYFYPTFDGDSIFNVFSIEPTTDARLGYRFDGAVRASANLWLRRYARIGGDSALTTGVDASLERTITRRLHARIDGLWDDGYGGRRVGGAGEAAWRAKPHWWLRGRAILLAVAPDDDRPRYATSTALVSSTWRVADSVAFHGITETSYDERHGLQVRGVGIIDLAFMPEP